ncbi:MAG: Uma2 family endonuclease [Pleurocapsa sp. SU_5_0]|nr:Uma2 family endonuclease [Pleurocapsa sp. SU_5_0]NJO95605.1 Uma2 family endonuclease [Pleurocapsa sp. CRU_1_2]NJR47443.1 Uma2 family endonuclease [Hyellaceae cyanobacterium CSU_1_1]
MNVAINLKAFTDRISDRDFEQLCADNPEAKFETTKEGKLIVMSPTGSQSGKFNMSLAFQVELWNRKAGKPGVVFDSSTGFKLSNGATRSPDVSWIELDRWNSLTARQQRGFAPIDPDFVIELMSPTDELLELQQKMSEYINCGVRLGWLINPDERQVEIYRVGQDKEVLDNPKTLSGETVLVNFDLDLIDIF